MLEALAVQALLAIRRERPGHDAEGDEHRDGHVDERDPARLTWQPPGRDDADGDQHEPDRERGPQRGELRHDEDSLDPRPEDARDDDAARKHDAPAPTTSPRLARA